MTEDPITDRTVARLIVPTSMEVPESIVAAVRACAAEVFRAACVELTAPRRVDFVEKLEAIKAAATTISATVTDPVIIELAADLRIAFGHSENIDVPLAMQRLIRMIDNYLSRMPADRDPRPPTFHLGHPPARLMCAVAIVELWKQQHGRAPGEKNSKAQRACADLWRLADQRQSERVASGCVDAETAWTRHLAAARARPPSPATAMARLQITGAIETEWVRK